MRELRQLKGPYWALPLQVEWVRAGVDPGQLILGEDVPLLKIQMAAARNRLLEAGAWEQQGALWLGQDALDQIAPSVPYNEDPEQLVEWRPWNDTVEYRKEPWRGKNAERRESARNRDEFFHEFCKLGWVHEPWVAEILWDAFMQHAMHWLLNEQRPVDFFFFQLHALPFRPNWKEMVRQLELTRYCDRITGEARWKDPEEWFLDSRLTSLDENKFKLQWMLEVLPTRNWKEFSSRYERARWRWPTINSDRRRYALRTLRLVKLKVPHLKKIYDDYFSRVSAPYLGLRSECCAGDAISPKTKIAPGRMEDCPDSLPSASRYALRLGQDREFDWSRYSGTKVGTVPDVPTVVQPVEDLRTTGPEMDSPGEPAAGTNGMPVPHGTGSVGEGEELLAVGTGG